jgi:cytoskeletal protein CcmA (bactofilin family)
MMGLKSSREENVQTVLHNILAVGTSVKGDITTEVDFRLDGKIEGNILCNGKIVIGPKGFIIGNIMSVNAEIMGHVEGSLKISGKLTFKSTAVVKGDIQTQTLEVEPNAIFNGTCVMSASQAAGQAQQSQNNHPQQGRK